MPQAPRQGIPSRKILQKDLKQPFKRFRLLMYVVPKSGYRGGYSVAIIVGLDEASATLWKVYSRVVKPEATVRLEGNRNSPKVVYNFHEAIINALRQTINEGVRSVILASPSRTNYAPEFIAHVKKHHAWLNQGSNKISFAEITGSAKTFSDVSALTKNSILHQLIQDATSQETVNLLELINHKLSSSSDYNPVLYSIEEIEDLIVYSRKTSFKPEILLLTDRYLASAHQKNRINRLMQIASNKRVKTRVVDAESPVGKRLSQLGGIVCLLNSV